MKLAHYFLCLMVIASLLGGLGFVSSTVETPQAENGAGSTEPNPGTGNHTNSEGSNNTSPTIIQFSLPTSAPLCPPCVTNEIPMGLKILDGTDIEVLCQKFKTTIMCIRENKCPEVPEMKKCDFSLDKVPETECGKCEYLLKNVTEDAKLKGQTPGSDVYCKPLYVPLACFEVKQCKNVSDLHKDVSSRCESKATVCLRCKNSLEEAVKRADKLLLSIIGGGVCEIIKTSIECLRDKNCAPVPDSTMTIIQTICPGLDTNEAVRATGPCRATVIFLSAVAHLTAWLRA